MKTKVWTFLSVHAYYAVKYRKIWTNIKDSYISVVQYIPLIVIKKKLLSYLGHVWLSRFKITL